jgi:hypothetical protein
MVEVGSRLREFIRSNSRFVLQASLDSQEGFRFTTDILDALRTKVFTVSRTFQDFGISITNGSVLGLTDAFVVQGDRFSVEASEFLRPILRGDDVRNFEVVGGSSVILLPEGLSDEELKSNYFEVYKHLYMYEGDLKYRAKGEWYRPSVKQGVNGCVYVRSSIRWYAVYLEDESIVLNDSMKVLEHEYAKCLVGIFNSLFMDRWFNVFCASNILSRSSVRDNTLVAKIPIPNSLDDHKEHLESLVDSIQSIKLVGGNAKFVERELEVLVRGMYGISDEEYAFLNAEMLRLGVGKQVDC